MNETKQANAMRVRCAALCIKLYCWMSGSEDENSLGDLMIDLMHWSRAEKFDFNAALFRASSQFEAELADADHESPEWVELAVLMTLEERQGMVDALEGAAEAVDYYDEHEGCPYLKARIREVLANAKGGAA
jgi:hypothetical protein